MRAHSLASTEEVYQLSKSTSSGGLPQQYVCERDPVFLTQVEWTPRCPDSKEGRFPCSGFNAGLSFISQDEGMSKSPVETLGKALGHCLIWTGGLTTL